MRSSIPYALRFRAFFIAMIVSVKTTCWEAMTMTWWPSSNGDYL